MMDAVRLPIRLGRVVSKFADGGPTLNVHVVLAGPLGFKNLPAA